MNNTRGNGNGKSESESAEEEAPSVRPAIERDRAVYI